MRLGAGLLLLDSARSDRACGAVRSSLLPLLRGSRTPEGVSLVCERGGPGQLCSLWIERRIAAMGSRKGPVGDRSEYEHALHSSARPQCRLLALAEHRSRFALRAIP